jgi:hypothetical protein
MKYLELSCNSHLPVGIIFLSPPAQTADLVVVMLCGLHEVGTDYFKHCLGNLQGLICY